MELARKILLAVESCPDARGPSEFEIEGEGPGQGGRYSVLRVVVGVWPM